MNRTDVLTKLLDAAAAAAEVVMAVYAESDVGVELTGPNDPVTRADREANALLEPHRGRSDAGSWSEHFEECSRRARLVEIDAEHEGWSRSTEA